MFLSQGGCWGDGRDPQTHPAVLAPWQLRIRIKAANEAAPGLSFPTGWGLVKVGQTPEVSWEATPAKEKGVQG